MQHLYNRSWVTLIGKDRGLCTFWFPSNIVKLSFFLLSSKKEKIETGERKLLESDVTAI